MTVRRWLPPAAVLLAAGAIVAGGLAAQVPESVLDQPQAQTSVVTGTTQVCPTPADVAEATTLTQAWTLPDPGVATSGLGGQAVLELLALTGAESGSTASASASTTDRGVTISDEPVVPVLVQATGELAPGVTSETQVSAAGERTSGLAGLSCAEPAREWWFVAGSGGVGERSTLVLSNPSAGPAVVDVEVWTEDGPLSTAGTNDLGVPAGGSREVSIDAVASGSERAAVRVRVSSGQAGAGLLVRQVSGADPIGLSWVTPSQAPALLSYIPGLPPFGERSVRLLNPGEEDAIASLRVLSGRGPFTPVGLEAIDVPAGGVVDVDLEAAGEEAFALEVSATGPVVTSAFIRQTPDSGLGDFAVVGSSATLETPGAARVTTEDGRSARLVLTALPEVNEAGTPMPTPSASSGSGADQDPDSSPSPAPTPDATGAPTSEDTPEVGRPAAGESAESDDFIEVETPTTQVLVQLVALDGALLEENVATLALGTTDTFPLDLPDGTTDAWVVVGPADAGRVMAAREVTTTVEVPDPLDPDARRDAFWLDLVPLLGVRTTVEVPPVVPDLTVGLPR